jgi:hypothetical protein
MSAMNFSQPLTTRIHSWIRKRLTLIGWCLVIGSACISVGLGTLGFYLNADGEIPLSTALYLAIQLLTLDSGVFAEKKSIGWVMETARWTGVAAAFGTIFNTILAVFSKRIDAFLCSHLSDHCVIIGVGRTGTAVLQDMLDTNKNVIIVDIDEEIIAAHEITDRAYTRIGDGRDINLLNQISIAHAESVVVCAGNDIRNVSIARSIHEAVVTRSSAKPPLRILAHLVDNRIEELVFGNDFYSTLTSWTSFNRWENSVRKVLNEHPLDRTGINSNSSKRVRLLIAGGGIMGETLLLKTLATAHYANDQLVQVTLIDPNASLVNKRLIEQFPEIHLCGNLEFLDTDSFNTTILNCLNTDPSDNNSITTIAACIENAQESAVLTADLFKQATNSSIEILAYLGDDTNDLQIQSHKQTNAKVFTFGAAEDICSAKYIFEGALDVLAKAIHENYVKKRSSEQGDPHSLPAMRPWEQLSTSYKDMNRFQADHLAVKVRALGFMIRKVDHPSGEWPRTVTNEEIESLARAEHRRWAASRRLTGWSYGPQRDEQKRKHPDLVPWEDLADSIKDYDRAPIRNIPTMLKEIGLELLSSPLLLPLAVHSSGEYCK